MTKYMSETYFSTNYDVAIPKTAAQSTAKATFSALAMRVLNTLGEWQTRADQRRRLLALDNRLLSDMGISRADAVSESEKPFWRE